MTDPAIRNIKARLQGGQQSFPQSDVLRLFGEIERLKPDAERAALLDTKIDQAILILSNAEDEE